MSRRWIILVLGLAACASTESSVAPSDSGTNVGPVPPPVDGGLDAEPDVDAGPCADCEYFPSDCSPDTLCPGAVDTSQGEPAINPGLTINAIRGRSVSDVWAAGAMGTVAHFDGTSWKRSTLGSLDTLNALWVRDSSEVALAHLSRVYARGLDLGDAGTVPSDGGWSFVEPTLPSEFPDLRLSIKFRSAWNAPGSPWLWCAASSVEKTGIWRMRLSPTNTLELQVGVSTQACTDAHCTQVTSIHGASPNEVWAVGEWGSAVLVTDAESDTPTVKAFNTLTRNALNGVWSASPSEAWAVGALGTIRHYAGHPVLWDVVSDVPTTEDLRAVWGSSSNDVWAVGDGALVLHFDGKAWSRVKIAGLGKRRPNLTTIWGAAAGHVWIGGEGAMLSLGGKP
ncbi:WD40/YVTN/BNR-like repeat-containing protein [Labilithrix luteola]|uniref:WD40/YVTN/BNR-like repeat-containing protein n=1 Tax=Labilithrix luteola TaxID=1391654 RepID=UPI0011BAD8D4|nr:hypothetical protein [Labilithrix luteola]